ncbi:hypothetical protein [Pseudarthrobacter phenanthrenivorans]|uniref:hypothetical protein n=1 Tax=Pseudarthrobacter phenanthrenivorans TaxID=361575 RepID=UPI001FE458A7|nr:hypothetical protein [Pseudarthrobacter phenanthrenivorans]
MPPTLATYTPKGINYFGLHPKAIAPLLPWCYNGVTAAPGSRASARVNRGVVVMDFFRQQLFNIIAFVFLGLFVAVWGSVLLRVGFWVPDGRTVAPPLNGALVTAAGVLATSLSSLTASALGFTIAEVRRDERGGGGAGGRGSGAAPAVSPSEVTARLSGRIVAAIVVYLAVGLLVLLLWLVKGTASTDLIGAFALSLLGWLIGAAGVVFQTEKSSD